MRYFLNIRRGEEYIADPDGTEAATLEDVVMEARDAAREILAERVRRDGAIDGAVFEITDESGGVIELVPLKSFLRYE